MINRAIGIATLAAALAFANVLHAQQPAEHTTAAAALKANAQWLIAAYPTAIDRLEGRDLVFKDGTRLPFDDGVGPKTFDQLLAAPDIKGQFAFAYSRDTTATPQVNVDPGRIRNEAFFIKLYGDCKKGQVAARLTAIDWLPKKQGGKIVVTKAQGVSEALAAVSRELDNLPAEFDRFLLHPAGGYNCRSIAGVAQRSAHAYGAAIDINARAADYWRWSKPGKDGAIPYRNRVPAEIVRVFERHGFIWGGHWYHYDTMHFEYRPELLAGPSK